MMKFGESIVSKAAVLREMGLPRPYTKSKPLSIESIKIESPQPNSILLKIRAASLCHSDLSVINGSRKRPMPMALGHEAAGEVIEVGNGVSPDRVQVGDHVVLTFSPSCGHCTPCSSGRGALCEKGAISNGAGTLIDGSIRLSDANGKKIHHHLGDSAFAEYAVVSPDSVVKIPKNLKFEHAALFGCAVMTGVGSVLNTAKVKLGESVAIIGLGGVGLSAVMGAYATGASQVIAVDLNDEKLELARSIGATHTINASNPNACETVRAISNGGVHHAIETAGVIAALKLAVQMTRIGGTTATAGLPPGGAHLDVDITTLVGQERRIVGSYMGSSVAVRDIPRYIDLFQNGRLPVDKLLSSIIKLEDINEGFDLLADAKAIRQVISFE